MQTFEFTRLLAFIMSMSVYLPGLNTAFETLPLNIPRGFTVQTFLMFLILLMLTHFLNLQKVFGIARCYQQKNYLI